MQKPFVFVAFLLIGICFADRLADVPVTYTKLQKQQFFTSCAYHEQTQTMILSYSGIITQMDSSGKEVKIGVQSTGEPNFAVVPNLKGNGFGWHPGDIIVGSTNANSQYLSLITFDDVTKTFSQNLTWLFLPVVASGAWGAFFFDTVGKFDYNLVYRAPSGQWMTISSAGVITQIPKPPPGNPESFGILSDDSARWGPYAGWIYSGDENGNHFVINPVDKSSIRVLRNPPFLISGERVDVLKEGYGFLGANVSEAFSVFVAPDQLKGLEGSILLQSEFHYHRGQIIAVTQYNTTTNDLDWKLLTAANLPSNVNVGYWEQGCITPMGIKHVPPANYSLCIQLFDSTTNTKSSLNPKKIGDASITDVYAYVPKDGSSFSTNPAPVANSIITYLTQDNSLFGGLIVIINGAGGAAGSLKFNIRQKNAAFPLSPFTQPKVMDDSPFVTQIPDVDVFPVFDANGATTYNFVWRSGSTDGFGLGPINMVDLLNSFEITMSVELGANTTIQNWFFYSFDSNGAMTNVSVPLTSTMTIRRVSCPGTCGNGVLDPYEDCEPSAASTCCGNDCKFKLITETCPALANSSCDVTKFCPGNSGVCPLPPKACQDLTHCAALAACGACNADPLCGWCCSGATTGSCYPKNETALCPAPLVFNAPCDCSAKGNCDASGGSCVCGSCDCKAKRSGPRCDQFLDCRNVAFPSETSPGFEIVDACGVCGGNSTSCQGCDHVPNSGCEFDNCGVCICPNSTTVANQCFTLRCPTTDNCDTCVNAGCQFCASKGVCVDGLDPSDCPEATLQLCTAKLVTIVAGSIAGGIVAAIVIGIVVAVVVSSVGSTAAYRYWKLRNERTTGITDNPLFLSANTEKNNPLYGDSAI